MRKEVEWRGGSNVPCEHESEKGGRERTLIKLRLYTTLENALTEGLWCCESVGHRPPTTGFVRDESQWRSQGALCARAESESGQNSHAPDRPATTSLSHPWTIIVLALGTGTVLGNLVSPLIVLSGVCPHLLLSRH